MPCLTFGRHSTGASRVAVTMMLHFLFTFDSYVCVKESSVEGTCSVNKKVYKPLQTSTK